MSAENPILLDDDEQEATSSTEFSNSLVGNFIEIMPHKSRKYAEELLERANNNLEGALALALDGEEEASQMRQHEYDRSMNQMEASAVPAASASTREMTDIHAASLKSAGTDAKDEFSAMMPLDKEWHRLYEMAQSTGTVFVDSDFPPTSVSVDGRRHTTTTASEAPVVACLCGAPAKSRTVQKDGPNYGRFYLACAGTLDKKCNFFQWDKDGTGGGESRYSQLSWHCFGPPECVLVKGEYSPSQVKQGAVGNCWFLSALAVVAEQPHFIRQLLPHTSLNDTGVYQVNLCLDGKWTPLFVDSHLPVVAKRSKQQQSREFRGIVGSDGLVPAFCDVPKGQVWAALVEKAYAKAHGSYSNLSGGFIAEALADMTGAPTETIVFDTATDNPDFQEVLWAQLLSFQESGFLMGVATSVGGQGLVGGHAYSVLDVLEFQDVVVGEQQRMTDFFTGASTPATLPAKKKQRTTVRLLRIRNPWGKREWKGEWSVSSDKWTMALRKRLGNDSYAKNDGTFFMSFQDVMKHFHHMDIAKSRKGWNHTSLDGSTDLAALDPLLSASQVYRLNVSTRTWAFVSLVQPKKRSNTNTRYWYGDLSMMMLMRRKGSDESWTCERSCFQGCSRKCTSEIFLDPSMEYVCIPFSYGTQKRGGSQTSPFRAALYSSEMVDFAAEAKDNVNSHLILQLLHRELLQSQKRVQYPVAEKGVLLCIHEQDCLYFVLLNAASDCYLSLRLTVDVTKGMILAHGCSGDTFDLPPSSQKIAMVAMSDGTDSAAASVTFSYVCDTITTNSSQQGSRPMQTTRIGIGSSLELPMVGHLIAGEITTNAASNKGGDTIETYHWLSQLGTSAS